MKNFKKVIAGALALLMLALSVNVSFAAEEKYTAKEEIVVAKVMGTGIMTGTDKGFEPAKSLTRAEAAAIIVRMKGISESVVKATAGTTLFTDVAASHWASGYVNQASNLGIVKGVSATLFAPDREVTIAEFTTMAIRALGAGQLVDSEGTWPTNYVNFANENEILNDVDGIYTAVSTRMQAATIVANTLKATMWTKSGVKSNGEIEWTKTLPVQTLLVNTLKYDYMNGLTVEEVSTKDRLVTVDYDEDDEVFEASRLIDISSYKVIDSVNLAGLKAGDEVDVWFSVADKEIVAIMPAEHSKQTKVEFSSIKKVENGKVTLVIDGKEVKYDIHKDGATVVYNEGTPSTLAASAKLDVFTNKEDVFGRATIVSGDIKGIYMEEYDKFGIVKEIKKDKVYYESDVTGADATFKFDFSDDCDDEYVITKEGQEVKALEAGDVIEYYKVDGKAKYVVNILTNTAEGKVTSIGDDYLKLDGTKYSFAKTFTYAELAADVSTKDEITVYLNDKDEVVMATVDEESMDSTIGIITSARAKNDGYGVLSYELKVTGLDNTESDVVTLDKVKFYDKLGEVLSLASADDSSEKKEAVDNFIDGLTHDVESLLGCVVRYAINSEKLTITEIAFDDDVYTSYEEAKITPVEGDINVDKEKIGNYKVTDSTVVYCLTEGDEDYELKLEAVDFDDLADDEFEGYALEIDEDTNKVKYFISIADLTRDDSNYGVVKALATSDVDDEMIITLLTAEGSVDLAIDEDQVGQDVVKGAVVKYNNGDKITKLTVDKTVAQVRALDAYKVIAFNEESIKFYVPFDDNGTDQDPTDDIPAHYDFVDCEEELLVLTFNAEDSEVYPKSLKINDLPTVDTFDNIDDANVEDEADEVIFLTKVVDEELVVWGLIYAE